MYLGAKRRYINTLPFLSFPFTWDGEESFCPPAMCLKSVVSSQVGSQALVTMAMHYRLNWFKQRWAQGLGTADEHSAIRFSGVWHHLLLPFIATS